MEDSKKMEYLHIINVIILIVIMLLSAFVSAIKITYMEEKNKYLTDQLVNIAQTSETNLENEENNSDLTSSSTDTQNQFQNGTIYQDIETEKIYTAYDQFITAASLNEYQICKPDSTHSNTYYKSTFSIFTGEKFKIELNSEPEDCPYIITVTDGEISAVWKVCG